MIVNHLIISSALVYFSSWESDLFSWNSYLWVNETFLSWVSLQYEKFLSEMVAFVFETKLLHLENKFCYQNLK